MTRNEKITIAAVALFAVLGVAAVAQNPTHTVSAPEPCVAQWSDYGKALNDSRDNGVTIAKLITEDKLKQKVDECRAIAVLDTKLATLKAFDKKNWN